MTALTFPQSVDGVPKTLRRHARNSLNLHGAVRTIRAFAKNNVFLEGLPDESGRATNR